MDKRNQPHHQQEMFETDGPETRDSGPVTCLGMTFENDEKRREYFLEKLREKLKDPEFRKIEGFPIGEDEDILALSDPPYYTACPNPFIEDFIKHYGKTFDPETDDYRREPFAADVSEGKNDSIYNAHTYHTKVPHKAIMRYILHYTEPGDIVFDGFCGTGMTAVASYFCSKKAEIESLGLKVLDDKTISDVNGRVFSTIGVRRAVVSELSPSATFIAHNYNRGHKYSGLDIETSRIIQSFLQEYGWMYETLHKNGNKKGLIDYVVYSDVYFCPVCSEEVILWTAGYDAKTRRKLKNGIKCDKCNAVLNKGALERVFINKYDDFLRKTVRVQKRVPVLIAYRVDGKKHEKDPDANDISLIDKVENLNLTDWFPTLPLPDGDKMGDPRNVGIEYVHQFYPKRALIAVSSLWNRAMNSEHKAFLSFCIQSVMMGFTFLNRFFEASFSQVNRYLKGTIYVAPVFVEVSPWYALRGKLSKLPKVMDYRTDNIVSTNCLSESGLPTDSVDYIFTDPPFGSNIMYSELNFIWESWLRVFTNNKSEAIQNDSQKKDIFEYQKLMYKCFRECYRILKPSRWMTVEFHNSKNSVWNAIQESLQRAGFVVADVRTIDKKQDTMNQMTSAGAVKQDLIISAYKPNDGLEGRFKLTAGTEDGVWDFVRTHLKQLPLFVSKNGQAEVIAERQNYLLFDRMVAFHVQRGVTVPLSAAEFYAGLEQRFPPRDGMYFLTDQAAEYDKKRMTVKEVLQLQLFVSDEASAIQWLKQQLTKKPQTFQDIHPQFLKEIGGWQKHEKPLELSELLKENLLPYDGKGEVPSQIHSYLSSNFKELRNLAKDDPTLRAKGKDRWYVPDPNKASDLEKLRERTLMREFEEYRESKQKRLKVFRLEAVRAGFKKAWQERDYATIIAVARKIPEKILQEDPKLLMWYDQAITRSGAND
jgi:DNA modification methylase